MADKTIETLNIILDSDSAQRDNVGKSFTFSFSNSINIENKEVAYISVRDFSCLQALPNIGELSTFKVTFEDDGGMIYEIGLDAGYYEASNFEGRLREVINSVLAGTGHNLTFQRYDTGVNTATHMKYEFYSTTGDFTLYDGVGYSIIRRLGISNNSKSTVNTSGNPSVISEYDTDLNTGIHNLYIAIDQIQTDTRVNASQLKRNNVIAKIPIVNGYGEYIMFQAQEPVTKFKYGVNCLNQITIRLLDDNNVSYMPSRFTLSLTVEKYYVDEVLMKDKIIEEVFKKLQIDNDYKHNPLASHKDNPVTVGGCQMSDPLKTDVSLGAVRSNRWWMGKNSVPYE